MLTWTNLKYLFVIWWDKFNITLISMIWSFFKKRYDLYLFNRRKENKPSTLP